MCLGRRGEGWEAHLHEINFDKKKKVYFGGGYGGRAKGLVATPLPPPNLKYHTFYTVSTAPAPGIEISVYMHWRVLKWFRCHVVSTLTRQ